MERLTIKIFVFIIVFFTSRSTQLELDIMKDIVIKNKEPLQKDIYPVTISRIIAIKDQFKVFGGSNADSSIKEHSSIFSSMSNNLKEFMGSNQKDTSGSNRGAFVIYDTNDYPFACNCNSAQYQNWKETGANSTTKVECTNTINTGIFNSNDIDYCDPTNIAASQSV
ncbi:uncharacterized protein cubi_00622 [Cryptosporidium ubiquitum]|uniref:Uncharacterized protein n=1 Tax=Cryptosporidium ubiquitum TaxID=857276 RepID=A0A1J4MC79_9CRYT|nr:uncharacterized protein cubi_00622 [Cryptosporidium ubiquitum]OII71814.1 hypothetical protein cubi_00622 [Cryptosporidium ubiquitum]